MPLTWVSGAIILIVVGLAVGGTALLTAKDPMAISAAILQPPSFAAPLGTDELGRSVLAQIVIGARISLVVGVFAALTASIFGVLIGSIAGYFGGLADNALMRAAEIFQVMPTFILAAVIVALAGPGQLRIIAVIALLSWPQSARLMRTEVLRIKQLEFVDAVRCFGVRESVILATEVVPNALAPVLAFATLTIAQAILLEASLSYFGLSSPDLVSWGRTLSSGQRFLYQAWWLSVFPGVAIFVTVLAFNIMGDCLREALNPRKDQSAQ